MSGFGVLLYIVLWIIVPLEGEGATDLNRDHLTHVAEEMKDKAQEVAGEVRKTVEEFKKKPKSSKKNTDESAPNSPTDEK
jgi:hypothetical protein